MRRGPATRDAPLVGILLAVALLTSACGTPASTEASTLQESDTTTPEAEPGTTTVSTPLSPGPPRLDPTIHTKPGIHELSLNVGGSERAYELLIPESYGPSEPTPLVVAFHGWTMQPSQMTRGAWGLLAEDEGFLLAAPAGLDNEWAVAQDEAEAEAQLPNSSADLAAFPKGDRDVLFTTLVIAEVSEYLNVDPTANFVVGVSAGGFMASRVACDIPSGLAGVGATLNSVIYSDPCETDNQPAVISVGHELDFTHHVDDATVAVVNWASHNHCASAPTQNQVSERVVATSYQDCGGGPVTMLVNEHSWVGWDAEAEIWRFFEALIERDG